MEIEEFIIYIKAVANRFRERTFETGNGSVHNNSQHESVKSQINSFILGDSQNHNIRNQDENPSVQAHNELCNQSTAALSVRLPEIPLPSFHSDIYKWPAFRDRFLEMVEQRPNLSNIEKIYYFMGYLKGDALDSLRGIPISGYTYKLALSTLEAKFDKPRLVACSLVEILLNAPRSLKKSLLELNKFITAFDESIAVLESLQIPNLGDFILFSLASRCLPLSCRTRFETQTVCDYPSVSDLFAFVAYYYS